MEPELRSDADAILDELLDLPISQRRQSLERRPDLDRTQRAAIEAILAEAVAADPFLDPSAVQGRPAVAAMTRELADDAVPDALSPGDRFAGYEVLALAGRGGMGEVYRARDERLGRDVALKVLPHDVADHPERLARFEREARLLASLNHPNIGGIYGLAEHDGRQALVLEFVEGTSLAEKIARGAMRLPDILAIARQIASALDAAHQRFVVHRDLKPANIKVTTDGTVKVLDFGLAKALGPEQPDEPGDAGVTTEWRPMGAVLGTPSYMSPEQALGHGVDERTDVWAFGCVLYEMLSGARAFPGDSPREITARVLEREINFDSLPSATPEGLRRLLRRTLVKDSKRRLASMADAVLDIDDAAAAVSRRHWRLPRLRPSVAASLAFLAVFAVAVVAWTAGVPRIWRTTPRPAVHLAVPIPASESLLLSAQPVAALSPDGSTIVYRAVRQGNVQLFRRSLRTLESQPIPGTQNAAAPFFSPDGAWLGFDGDGGLQKVAMAGGSPVPICSAPGGATATWARDTIVFATAAAQVLQRVSAGGGTPEPVTTLDPGRGDLSHAFPHLLPGADAVLFTVVTRDRRHVAVLRLDSRAVTVLTEGSQPRYLPNGQLIFVRNDSLWLVPFDTRRLELRGEPAPVLEGLDTSGGNAANFVVSESGTLMYVPRREEVRERRLVWVDRRGIETPMALEPGRYHRAALSPDGRRIAVALSDGENTDIWIGQADQGTLIRLTRDPTNETSPIWSPDGGAVIFRSDREGGGLFRLRADATGAVERLTASEGTFHTPHGWTADGSTLLFTEFRTYTEQSLAMLEPGAAGPRRLLGGPFAQLRPQVSPDGRWLAYQSDESGRYEIYVRPFPSLEGSLTKVSSAGGTSPRWTQHGRELVYYDGRGFLAVPVVAGTPFVAGRPERLFDYAPYTGRLGPDYDVTPDGRRFLLISSAEESPGSRAQLVLVQNWIDDLR
jgi:serine/threonine-protein kinase